MRQPRSKYDARYRLTQSYADSQRRYRESNLDRVRANRRAAQRRRRERAKLPAGAAAALATLERSLMRATEPALVKRLTGAVANLRKLYVLPEPTYDDKGDMRRRKVGHGL